MSEITVKGRNITKTNAEISKKIFSDFKNDKISKEEFFKKYESFNIIKRKGIANFKKKRKDKRNSISYFGYKNKRQYKFWVGIGVFVLIMCLRFSIKILKTSTTVFEKLELLIYCSISGFMFTWAVKNFQDYEKSKYLLFTYLINIVIFIFGYFLFKFYLSIESKLKKGIQLLISYILGDLYKQRGETKKALIEDLEILDKLNKTLE